MKKLCAILVLTIISLNTQAQKVISNGFPGVGVIDGTNYTRTNTIGTFNFQFVAANTQMGFASSLQSAKIFFIDLTTETITDSLALLARDMEALNDDQILFAIRGSHIYRINTATKAIMDSVDIASNAMQKIERRPNTKELWVSADSNVYVVDYLSGLNKTSFQAGHHNNDGGDLRFTTGGTVVYKVLGARAKVFKIDAVNKTVLDSASVSNNIAGIEVSSDSSKLFVSSSNAKKIYVYQTSDMSLIDSIDSPREPFAMYRHPSRNEIWCINHFDDTVTVYNETNFAEIAAIDLPASPHNIAFALGTTADINSVDGKKLDVAVYPNPSRNIIHISVPSNLKYNIKIFDNSGKFIYSKNSLQNIVDLNVENFASGMYFLTIDTDTQGSETLQWIKE